MIATYDQRRPTSTKRSFILSCYLESLCHHLRPATTKLKRPMFTPAGIPKLLTNGMPFTFSRPAITSEKKEVPCFWSSDWFVNPTTQKSSSPRLSQNDRSLAKATILDWSLCDRFGRVIDVSRRCEPLTPLLVQLYCLMYVHILSFQAKS